MTSRYRLSLSIMWRLLALAALCFALTACGSGGDDEVAGIDGSGAPVDPVAPSPEPPELPPIPPLPPEPETDITVAAQGTINGFGSIIVHGDRYDTTHAKFYRHGLPVPESAFEVGDMVAVTGYTLDGVLYAKDVFFDPVLSGRIEQYDEVAGTFTMLGQTVSLDADTVVGGELNDEALWGRNVTVSGWQGDSQIVATRIALNDRPEVTTIRGHVKSNDANSMEAFIGEVWVDYSNVANVPSMQQGDIVLFEGELIKPENGTRYLRATMAVNISVTLSANEVPLESAVVAGIVRNIASYQRFWVNGVEIALTENSQVERGGVGDLASGQLVIVHGAPTAADKMDARNIKIIDFASKLSFTGAIEMIDADSQTITVAGQAFDVVAATSLADLQQVHSRLTLADLRLGDYVVVSAVAHEQGHEALSIKRTTLGVNDRKFDGTDVVMYEWGFPLGNPSNIEGENLLFSGRLHAAHPAMSTLEIGSLDPSDEKIVVRIKIAEENYSRVFEEANVRAEYQATLDLLDKLYEFLAQGRTVWINLQGDDRRATAGIVFADKLHFMVDREGPFIDGDAIPAEDAAQ
ncbi:DUF5666 domain-containing protein [Marinagarivorans cellulosilyticus]|uniref:DUF5666 domain-containing protein n=1 Tax=Marinagarivorans cellulosilyticus TaxID=2721545 RepID=A0AAN1WEM4_9GAMM|nr:DUF5666 domain-containing protein [Marinagarivorans cellulosilyticus]BCD96194.1 hypothetical protein MARGE09_P0393 [Marinagarivorans cellulosilyticus]